VHQQEQIEIGGSRVAKIYVVIGSKASQQDLKPSRGLRVVRTGIMLEAVRVGENRESHRYF
jgi:hypothetical protein